MELRNESDTDLLEQGYLLSLMQQNSQREPIFLGLAKEVRRIFFCPKKPQIALKKNNLTATLLKPSVHEVTWKCHQALAFSEQQP